jgi:hypothetical protein
VVVHGGISRVNVHARDHAGNVYTVLESEDNVDSEDETTSKRYSQDGQLLVLSNKIPEFSRRFTDHCRIPVSRYHPKPSQHNGVLR